MRVKEFLFGLHCAAIGFYSENSLSQAMKSCESPTIVFSGLNRTDETWLKDYLSPDLANILPEAELAQLIQRRIMTTDVFTRVDVTSENDDSGCRLKVDVDEKWTRIPVIRGAYGGGTPLTVLGAYETHAFGKLYSLGGEVRRYGTRPWGAYLFAKSPRAWRGKGSFGGELWLDRRRRGFFDAEANVLGYADSEAWTAKSQILFPFSEASVNNGKIDGDAIGGAWQWGAHIELVRESRAVFLDREFNDRPDLKPSGVSIPSQVEGTAQVMPMLVFDRLTVDRMSLDGFKGMIRSGGQISQSQKNGDDDHQGRNSFSLASETEVFAYSRPVSSVNLALHAFAGNQAKDSLRSLYFLGGFDSVRGLPDGIHFGRSISYLNLEGRWQFLETKYLHAQAATFLDHGAAFSSRDEFLSQRETAVGGGIRLSVPQVYRLLVRVDYGVSIGSTKSRGLSIGLGQF
ncbi:MAG: hypothetical protein NT027_05485, partial [Proteobacteria bacterium]|nr:hypothetical protein [Pseudomonadota bacterium]